MSALVMSPFIGLEVEIDGVDHKDVRREIRNLGMLLESNGTQPYVQPASELRTHPDFRNPTVLAKITYLALNATNPEVKEEDAMIVVETTASLV